MGKLSRRPSKRLHLPPGTLTTRTDRKEETRITVIDYDEQSFQEKQVKNIEECFVFKEQPTVTWINIDGLSDVAMTEKLGSCYGLHPLILEDILNTDQRPKTEDFDSYIYAVMRMLSFNDKNNEVESEQLSLLLGKNFLISFQERQGDVFELIRQRIRNSKGRIRKAGPDYLAYALIDSIVDNYFLILERLGDKVEFMEEELVSNPTPKTLKTIHNLKREMLFLRKSVWPLREVISGLERGESALIKKESKVYLRDVYDHTIQVLDTAETLRDMVSSMIDIYLSSISNKLNEVMKVLTIIATIFIPLTFVSGIYGMNFRYMPELEWRWGYFIILFIMASISISMLFYFKRKKWL